MKKVICVTPIRTTEDGCESYPRPEVGDTDTVLHAWPHHNGETYYTLERFGDHIGYKSDCFATLPKATADDLQEEIVNPETVSV